MEPFWNPSKKSRQNFEDQEHNYVQRIPLHVQNISTTLNIKKKQNINIEIVTNKKRNQKIQRKTKKSKPKNPQTEFSFLKIS